MATTLKLVEWFAAGVVTTAGVPVASGKARFYQPSTLTPANVYSDDAGAAAISQPLTLSAGGTATVYTLDPVRVIIKDSLDTTTLYDVTLNILRHDQVYVTSSSFNGGVQTTLETILAFASDSFGGTAGYWNYKEGSTATERPIVDWLGQMYVSVKDYGALGNDSADDRAAIQAAINRVAAFSERGTVLIPAGTYRISSALTVSSTAVSIRGLGSIRSVIKNTNATGNALTISAGFHGQFFEDFGIQHTSNSTGNAIQVTAGNSHKFSNLAIEGHRGGIIGITGSTISPSLVLGCYINTENNAAARGIQTIGPATVISSYTTTGAGYGIECTGALGSVACVGCRFQGTGAGSAAGGPLINSTGVGFSFLGCVLPTITITNGGGVVTTGSQFDGNLHIVDNSSRTVFSVAGGASCAPDLDDSFHFRVRGTSAGTVTIAPADLANNGIFTFFCYNNSGGAVTFAWSAAGDWITSGAVSPADGTAITVAFQWDATAGNFYECFRSAAVTV